MSSAVPEGWRSSTYAEELSVRNQQIVNDGTHPHYSLTIANGVTPKTDRYHRDFLVRDKDAKKYKIIQPNDLTFNPSNLRWGAIARSKISFPVIVSPIYEILFSKDESRLDPVFLEYFSESDPMMAIYIRYAEGTLVERTALKLPIFLQIPIVLPPLPEQKKIASILTSVDEVIEKTESQIAKLQDLKTGMMQELLIKGIGHTEFKDSSVGRIPVGWECLTVEQLLSNEPTPMRSGPFGSALLKHELVPEGIPYLGIDNVHVERFAKSYKRFVSPEKFNELSRYAVRSGDVMVTIMGTVGRCCVVPSDVGDALSSKHVWTMTLDKSAYIPELLCWQINYADWVKRQFLNESQGGVMDSISSATLRNLWIPVPSPEEQRQIAKVHAGLSQRILTKENHLDKQRALKKALMQDLLTGKVRVKTD